MSEDYKKLITLLEEIEEEVQELEKEVLQILLFQDFVD